MKRTIQAILLALTCSLHTCATTATEFMSGKEVTVSMGADGKPQVGISFK